MIWSNHLPAGMSNLQLIVQFQWNDLFGAVGVLPNACVIVNAGVEARRGFHQLGQLLRPLPTEGANVAPDGVQQNVGRVANLPFVALGKVGVHLFHQLGRLAAESGQLLIGLGKLSAKRTKTQQFGHRLVCPLLVLGRTLRSVDLVLGPGGVGHADQQTKSYQKGSCDDFCDGDALHASPAVAG